MPFNICSTPTGSYTGFSIDRSDTNLTFCDTTIAVPPTIINNSCLSGLLNAASIRLTNTLHPSYKAGEGSLYPLRGVHSIPNISAGPNIWEWSTTLSSDVATIDPYRDFNTPCRITSPLISCVNNSISESVYSIYRVSDILGFNNATFVFGIKLIKANNNTLGTVAFDNNVYAGIIYCYISEVEWPPTSGTMVPSGVYIIYEEFQLYDYISLGYLHTTFVCPRCNVGIIYPACSISCSFNPCLTNFDSSTQHMTVNYRWSV